MNNIIGYEIKKRSIHPNGKPKPKYKKTTNPKPYIGHKGNMILVGKELRKIIGENKND